MEELGGRVEEIGEEVGRVERRNEQVEEILRRVVDIGVRAGWSELQSTPLRVVTLDEERPPVAVASDAVCSSEPIDTTRT